MSRVNRTDGVRKWIRGWTVGVSAVLAMSAVVRAETIAYSQITPGNYGDLASKIVTTVQEGKRTIDEHGVLLHTQAVFTFSWDPSAYAGHEASARYAPGVIDAIYFQDGTLLDLLDPTGVGSVDFYQNYQRRNGRWIIAPANLPGWNIVDFHATQAFSAEADGATWWGVGQAGDKLVLTFDLQPDVTFARTLIALGMSWVDANGKNILPDEPRLRVGLHVQAIANTPCGTSNSASFVSMPLSGDLTPSIQGVPLPDATWAGGVLLAGLIVLRIRARWLGSRD